MQTNDDRLFKFILRCKAARKPELHSFMIEVDGGRAFVECRDYGEVYIEKICFGDFDENGRERRERFCGTPIAATNFLVRRNARFETIDQIEAEK